MPATPDTLHIAPGFAEEERDAAAMLFWQAFRGKLRRVLSSDDRALSFLRAALNPDYAFAARDAEGRLLGLAGIKTGKGGLVGGRYRDLVAIYGHIGAIWRTGLLALLERPVEDGTLLMDGIFVAPEARGRGVGTALLDAVQAKARSEGLQYVRLDVVDGNDRARALYERNGFVAGKITRIGPLRHVFGFKSSTEMRREL